MQAYLEGDVGELHARARAGSLAAPVLVDVQSVSGATSQEVLKEDVLDVAASAVALEHVHLVATVGVDVAVVNVRDGSSVGKRSHGASTRLVAPNALDEEVGCGRLDGDTFVAVGDLNIVDPMVDPLRRSRV